MRVQWLPGLVLAFAGTVVSAQNAPGVYTCTDASGRTYTSDRPIPECNDREQKVLNPSGTVRQIVGPSLTAKERAVLDAQKRREQEERNRQQEEKRRDMALLIRYPDRASHDIERAKALAQIDAVIQTATTRQDELEKQSRALDHEMEFYKKDPSKAPAYLQRQVEDNRQSLIAEKRFIQDQRDESQRVNQRFDDELERLRSLWTSQQAAH